MNDKLLYVCIYILYLNFTSKLLPTHPDISICTLICYLFILFISNLLKYYFTDTCRDYIRSVLTQAHMHKVFFTDFQVIDCYRLYVQISPNATCTYLLISDRQRTLHSIAYFYITRRKFLQRIIVLQERKLLQRNPSFQIYRGS